MQRRGEEEIHLANILSGEERPSNQLSESVLDPGKPSIIKSKITDPLMS